MLKLLKTKNLPVSQQTRSHNPILLNNQESPQETWISATEFDNWAKNDKISDWFSVLKNHFIIDEESPEHPLSFLFKKGSEYETKIVNSIQQKTGLILKKISSLNTSREYSGKNTKFIDKDLKNTIDLMQHGCPVIYSGFIADKKEKLRGIPDLLVRNDYISSLFPNLRKDVIDIVSDSSEKSIFGNYYYLPIEIKFSSLYFDSTQKYLLNMDRTRFYKTQLFTYCKILNEIQGLIPRYAFIIGKRTIVNKTVYDCFEKPGFIDYKYRDNEIVKFFYDGLDWLRDVKKNGINWDLNADLYPNMKVDNPVYNDEKRVISESIGEITEIWQCGVKHRVNAIAHKITSWKDPRLTSEILGVNDQYKDTIDLLLKINRGELGDYYPKKFTKNTNDWKNKISDEMFVDFETVRDSLDLDSYGEDEKIFLIGVWYKDKYTYFLMNTLSEENEKQIILEFYEFWKNNGSPKIWYWFAESEMWSRAMRRHSLDLQLSWYDLYQVFKDEPFVVKGCKNFKLKSYVKSLVNLKYIDIELPPSDCCNGMDAMITAWRYYNENQNNQLDSVIVYNEFDCKSLDKLLQFIRSL